MPEDPLPAARPATDEGLASSPQKGPVFPRKYGSSQVRMGAPDSESDSDGDIMKPSVLAAARTLKRATTLELMVEAQRASGSRDRSPGDRDHSTSSTPTGCCTPRHRGTRVRASPSGEESTPTMSLKLIRPQTPPSKRPSMLDLSMPSHPSAPSTAKTASSPRLTPEGAGAESEAANGREHGPRLRSKQGVRYSLGGVNMLRLNSDSRGNEARPSAEAATPRDREDPPSGSSSVRGSTLLNAAAGKESRREESLRQRSKEVRSTASSRKNSVAVSSTDAVLHAMQDFTRFSGYGELSNPAQALALGPAGNDVVASDPNHNARLLAVKNARIIQQLIQDCGDEATKYHDKWRAQAHRLSNMNWPSLSAECSQAIAEVLRDAVHLKPKDLLEHTAQQLQKRSGLDPDAFAAHFEECRRRPRTYVLEDWCPAGQDPMKWVPMRYNDDTILRTLQNKAGDLTADVFSELLVEDTRPFLDRFTVAFPEFQYMKASPEECLSLQYIRAIYIGCSRCPDVLPQGLDDADPQLAFRCEAFIEFARGQLFDIATQDEDALEAIVVCCMLRALGSHTGFQQRFGGGLTRPMEAVMYAVEHNIEALPSFHRLSECYRELILAVSQALFPLDMLVTSEVVPTHFQRIKERVAPKENGIAFYMAVAAVDYMVQYRNVMIVNEVVDLLRLGIQSFTTIEKYTVLRSYELYLKRRAERHSWRLVKDDFAQRAAIRLCCFVGREDDDAWTEILETMDHLSDDEKEVLSMELGKKDGIAESPVYVPVGAAAFLAQAAANEKLTVEPALRLLIKILEDAALSFDCTGHLGCVSLHMEKLTAMAREYRPGKSVPFEDLPFTFQEVDASEIIVQMGSEH